MAVASLSTFRTRPEKFFDWFRPLARLIIEALPNPAHTSLSSLQQMGRLNSIITQNVDRLHQKAGSKNIIEVHGSMETLTCVQCYKQVNAEEIIHLYIEDLQYPVCTSCGGTLKPDVILFGEQMPIRPWKAAEQEVRKSDLLIVVGSSLEVNPVARLPYEVLVNGGKLIIINKQKTYINSRANFVFQEDVADVLPAIVEAVQNG
jgi:NAD-dependent deacetylase